MLADTAAETGYGFRPCGQCDGLLRISEAVAADCVHQRRICRNGSPVDSQLQDRPDRARGCCLPRQDGNSRCRRLHQLAGIEPGLLFARFAGGLFTGLCVCIRGQAGHIGPRCWYRGGIRPQSPGWNGSGFDRSRVWAGRDAKRRALAVAGYTRPILKGTSCRDRGRDNPSRIDGRASFEKFNVLSL